MRWTILAATVRMRNQPDQRMTDADVAGGYAPARPKPRRLGGGPRQRVRQHDQHALQLDP